MHALLLAWLCARASAAHAGLLVDTKPTPGGVPLDGAVIVAAAEADPLEAFVARDLADDLRRFGLRASVGGKGTVQICVGTPAITPPSTPRVSTWASSRAAGNASRSHCCATRRRA
ncbi:hypothetical protein [Roseateles sp.]|uniref:hypothetical protein n=1 Tax=Roseateles sp. TaxID=1971397 RepID=UPI0025CE76BA|nr:hypothetical protein [Roseateles sp.]MBV8034595.1 hypothetical protein [Roseateles sp.]